MSLPKALLLSSLMLSVAVVLAARSVNEVASRRTYQLAATGSDIFRIERETGFVDMCRPEMDRGLVMVICGSRIGR